MKNEAVVSNSLFWTVIAICILPLLLTMMGADFGTNHMTQKIDGSFAHTLLEWTAFCTAIFTVILAFTHFSINRDIATPVIAIALFFAGCMDAFHVLVENNSTEPFTWVLCRSKFYILYD